MNLIPKSKLDHNFSKAYSRKKFCIMVFWIFEDEEAGF